MEIDARRKTLQEAMNFASALAFGMEQLAGRGANGMAFAAGRRLGVKFSENAAKTDDILTALDEVRGVLEANSCKWLFEPLKKKNETELIKKNEDGSVELKLVFRDCMIRQSLFSFGHEQKGSLCRMMYGFFSGALETIMNKKSELEIIHAGENACLKCLKVHS